MNRPPAFQFYPKDWMDFKVQRMSYEAQGIYIRILCHMWSDSKDWCSILNNDKAIASTLGISIKKWLSIKKEMQYENDPLFKEKNGKFFSLRLKKEAKKLKEFRAKQAEKGRKSALTRGTTVKPRLNHGATGGATKRQPPLVQPEGNSSTPSSSSISSKEKDTTYAQKELDSLFEKWFKRYPRTDDKGKAKSKWLNLIVNEGVDPQLLEDALTGYINHLHADGTDDLKYVKHAKTFLYNGDKKKKIDPTWRPFVKYADPKHKKRPEL